nr:unnamed protein product [Fasciola hepatica]
MFSAEAFLKMQLSQVRRLTTLSSALFSVHISLVAEIKPKLSILRGCRWMATIDLLSEQHHPPGVSDTYQADHQQNDQDATSKWKFIYQRGFSVAVTIKFWTSCRHYDKSDKSGTISQHMGSVTTT